jgi:hypothetical protein
MGAPRKTANVENLQRQLDAAFRRRKKPDGWIGDTAHQGRASGHNPDDTPGSKPAWDGDPDSTAEVRDLDVKANLGDGVDGQDLVDHLIRLPGLATVIRYLIHRGHIYHQRNGFTAVRFAGDPHNEHVHIEGAWAQAADNNATFDFHLEDIAMPSADEIANAVIKKLDTAPLREGRTLGGSVNALCENSLDAKDSLADIEAKVEALTETVTALAAKVAG